MKLLSRRVLAELGTLQTMLRDAASDRNASLRVFRASRNAALVSAQHEYWLEFFWIDQEYRHVVRKLAEFCARHDASLTLDQRKQA